MLPQPGKNGVLSLKTSQLRTTYPEENTVSLIAQLLFNAHDLYV